MIINAASMESEVRYYSRLFPDIFAKGTGSYLYNKEGKAYLDFFCGSGSLNYGHSNPIMKNAVIEYLISDGIINSLDQMTEAKYAFMEEFFNVILRPRNFNYKMQFCGPTGTNSVEAAIKLSRKYTGREKIMFFEHSFHGMSYGSMSVSGMKRKALKPEYYLNTVQMPYAEHPDSIDSIRRHLAKCSTEDIPAAVILETIQAEGGMKTATREWIESVYQLAKQYEILVILDDIQTGCGRTGTFFSFENMDIKPDIICLSKSLSGYGFPLSVNLLNPDIDCWEPAEHNGTFRGNNLAFVAARKVLGYWKDEGLSLNIRISASLIEEYFRNHPLLRSLELRGRGVMRGVVMESEEINTRVQQLFFQRGLLADTCGYDNNVFKIMPPLTIERADLEKGLQIIGTSVKQLLTAEVSSI
ncbi:MAG: diaminobutyrate--2-oxoglutarate transaminase [Bacteroidetes bacterium]|nr:diaminobutyrate--2-oxoglutarate transaminase [Bacteroidota bacterium]